MIEDLLYVGYYLFSWFLIGLWLYSLYYQINVYFNDYAERVSLKDLLEEEMKYNQENQDNEENNISNTKIEEKHNKLLSEKENRLEKIIQAKKED